MKAYEFSTRIASDGKLELPDHLKNCQVRVIVLVDELPDPQAEDEDDTSVEEQPVFAGHSMKSRLVKQNPFLNSGIAWMKTEPPTIQVEFAPPTKITLVTIYSKSDQSNIDAKEIEQIVEAVKRQNEENIDFLMEDNSDD